MDNCYLQCRFALGSGKVNFGYFLKIDRWLYPDDFGASEFPVIELPKDWEGERFYLFQPEPELLAPCFEEESEAIEGNLVNWIEHVPEVPIRAVHGSVYKCLFVAEGLYSEALFVYDGQRLEGAVGGAKFLIEVGPNWTGQACMLKLNEDAILVPADVLDEKAFWRIALVTAANEVDRS